MFTTQPSFASRRAEFSSISVVVYGTSWCAASQMVRRHLDRLGIPYRYRDVEYDRDAAQRVQWWNGGTLTHPTIQIRGQILVEPILNELDWALRRTGLL